MPLAGIGGKSGSKEAISEATAAIQESPAGVAPWLRVVLCTERLQVQSLDGAHMEGNRWMFLSLSKSSGED